MDESAASSSSSASAAAAAASVAETFSTDLGKDVVVEAADFLPPWLTPEETREISFPFQRLADAAASDAERGAAAEDLRAIINEHGYVVVTGVLQAQELAELEESFRRDLEDIMPRGPGGKKQDPMSYRTLANTPLPGHFQHSFAAGLGLPHCELSWRCRLHPNVRRVFGELYPDEPGEQVVGLDNLFFTARGTPMNEEKRLWPHADLNKWVPRSGHWSCMQGVLYIWSSEPDELVPHKSTTVLQPRSHTMAYDSLVADDSFRHGKKHSCSIKHMTNTDKRDRLMRAFCTEARRIPVPAGGLLIWSSRTIHQGWVEGPRLAQPVCWEPAARRDHAALVRKAKMTIAGLPSSHWASVGVVHSIVKQNFFPERKQPGGWSWLPSYGLNSEAPHIPRDEMEALMVAAEREKSDDGKATRQLLAQIKPEIVKVL